MHGARYRPRVNRLHYTVRTFHETVLNLEQRITLSLGRARAEFAA